MTFREVNTTFFSILHFLYYWIIFFFIIFIQFICFWLLIILYLPIRICITEHDFQLEIYTLKECLKSNINYTMSVTNFFISCNPSFFFICKWFKNRFFLFLSLFTVIEVFMLNLFQVFFSIVGWSNYLPLMNYTDLNSEKFSWFIVFKCWRNIVIGSIISLSNLLILFFFSL